MITHTAEVGDLVNIGPRQRRLRELLGLALVALGVAIAALLVGGGAPRAWRLALVVPFATGVITYLEGRRGVCPLTAERGRRDLTSWLSSGGESIGDAGLAARLRQRGRRLSGEGTLLGLALTAAALALPA